MRRLGVAVPRADVGAAVAGVLFLIYALTSAPDVTFWDAGEFIAAAKTLGIPHPPGTPLFVLLDNAWARLLPFSFAVASNLLSAVATASAAGICAHLLHRATGSRAAAAAAALAAGCMSSIWLNATETEVYAASLFLGVAMLYTGERAGRDDDERWTMLSAYLIALAVPLHLSALVAAPAAIVFASLGPWGWRWHRALVLGGALVLAAGVGRMSPWLCGVGAVLMIASVATTTGRMLRDRIALPLASLVVVAIASSALAFLIVRSVFDPGINQGDPATFVAFADVVARRQYDVAPLWPRSAPAWVQLANLGQYADWQVALSLGPTVMPSILRSLGTVLFVGLGVAGAITHWESDRRSWWAVFVLFVCGTLGVLVYLNLHAGPSMGYGILPANVVREARERDYFFVFGFLAWGLWAGIGAVSSMTRFSRPAWAGVVLACVPIALNWRAVTRRSEPESSLPRAWAQALLASTPRNAALFVAGDNDSYPLWYAQQVLGIRRDVAVITVPLLPTQWYRDEITRRYALLRGDDIRKFDGTFRTAARVARVAAMPAVSRPIVVSATLTKAEREQLGTHWSANGVSFVQSGASGVDTVNARRLAAFTRAALGRKRMRLAIDPVHSYFRRVMDCPEQVLSLAGQPADSSRLDSVCNYR